MALHVSQLDYEHREVVLREKPAHMLEVSPKGTVPVFINEDGDVIEESLQLMQYALEQNDPYGWLDCSQENAAALISDNDGPFKFHLDRYKYASRYKSVERGELDLSHREQAEKHLAVLNAKLANTPFLLGNKQSYADIAIFPFVRQFANTDINWWNSNPYSNLQDWLTRYIHSDLFLTIMTKFPQWVPPTRPFKI